MNNFDEALKIVDEEGIMLSNETTETVKEALSLASRIEPFREKLQKLEDIVEGVQTMANSIRSDIKMAYHMDGVELPSINMTLNRIDAELNLARPLFKAILGEV